MAQRAAGELWSAVPLALKAVLRPDLKLHQLRTAVKLQDRPYLLPAHFRVPNPLAIPRKNHCPPGLSVPLRKCAGRNHHGKITVRHRGGGYKRRIRLLDVARVFADEEVVRVVRIEHDPMRSGKIALAAGQKRLYYVLAAEGMRSGDVIHAAPSQEARPEPAGASVPTLRPTAVGSTWRLAELPVGTAVHNIELQPGRGGQLVRAAGTVAILLARELPTVLLKLPSGATKKLPAECRATVGTVSNGQWRHRVIGKAGRARNLGWRPTVRGVAMNAVDHPHGGGKGGRGKGVPSQSPWGKICK